MKIGIGCDNLAIGLKDTVVAYLEEQNLVAVEVVDFGVKDPAPVHYPDIAEKVAVCSCQR